MSADRLNLMADEILTLSPTELAYVLRRTMNRIERDQTEALLAELAKAVYKQQWQSIDKWMDRFSKRTCRGYRSK